MRRQCPIDRVPHGTRELSGKRRKNTPGSGAPSGSRRAVRPSSGPRPFPLCFAKHVVDAVQAHNSILQRSTPLGLCPFHRLPSRRGGVRVSSTCKMGVPVWKATCVCGGQPDSQSDTTRRRSRGRRRTCTHAHHAAQYRVARRRLHLATCSAALPTARAPPPNLTWLSRGRSAAAAASRSQALRRRPKGVAVCWQQ